MFHWNMQEWRELNNTGSRPSWKYLCFRTFLINNLSLSDSFHAGGRPNRAKTLGQIFSFGTPSGVTRLYSDAKILKQLASYRYCRQCNVWNTLICYKSATPFFCAGNLIFARETPFLRGKLWLVAFKLRKAYVTASKSATRFSGV